MPVVSKLTGVTLATLGVGAVLATCAAFYGYAYLNQSPRERVASPISTAKSLEPARSNMFAGRLRAVPELELRRLLSEARLPGSVEGLEMIAASLTTLRETRAKTPSGVLQLSHKYFAFRDVFRKAYSHPASKAGFDKVYAEWEATRLPSPSPYIIKAHVLSGLLKDAIEAANESKNVVPAQVAEVQSREAELLDFLEKIKPIASSDPTWYLFKIATLKQRCQPFESIWRVADEGSTRYPDFYQIYFDVLLAGVECQALAPDVLLDRVVMLAVEKTKGFDGDGAYARMFWVTSQYLGDEFAFQPGLFDWPRVTRAMDDVVKSYPDAWNINNFARFSCIAKDAAKARDLLPKVLELPVLKVWGRVEDFETCWRWAMSSAGPAVAPVK
jgi:hypothetical protein